MAITAKLSALGLYRWNPNLFADMVLPEGLEKEEVVHAILEDTAELEILYPEPDYMQESIGHWSAARLQSWEKMQAAITAEYNPIWNKDGKVIDTHEFGKRHGTGVNEITAFNTNTYQPNERSTADQDAAKDVYTRIEQGNIGVTKSQEMVNDEMELRARWNMISVIVSEFKNKYCLMVY